ncbi:hypothetical protein [Zoogloea sp. LCSB751]|uniref:hypothetical protein n=1 Tax=Zoogloea sp. LCSB751 TaxID=1965277 RepID=UPI0009A54FA2|nr:hypothetical protein [Zoogloea sp. LCSB751]
MKITANLALAALCVLPATAIAQGHAGKHEPALAGHSAAEAVEHKGKADHIDRKDSPCAHEARARTQAATEKAPDAARETTSIIYPPGFATGPSSNDSVE